VSEYLPGTVVRYQPERGDRWCREGTAIVQDNGALLDTYWGSGGEAHRLTAAELATAEVLFRLSDYDELDRYKRGSADVWKTYHQNDRQRVTSQHGLQARWFVRKGAQSDHATRVENAREALREAEHEASSAERRVAWRREELAQLEVTS
jgi:hypothetical protein